MLRPALDLVLTALEQIRENPGRPICASRGTLSKLRPHLNPLDAPPSRDPGEDAPPPGEGSFGRKIDRLESIRARVAVCTKCPHLASSRTQTVFGVGDPDADLMFIGEAPGADEDAQGEPFVGRAGQLLTKIIETMGFARGDVYIANILKCRPDMPAGSFGNRAPTPVEMQTCRPYLVEQVEIIQPKVIVALGATAVEGLLGARGTMRELRGRWQTCNETPLMITYHPAYLLRNQSPTEKRKVWEDMLLVLERLERPITEKQRKYFL
jgi:DNA polymerase